MKRFLALAVTAVIALANTAQSQVTEEELYEKAKAEGELTWYVAQFSTGLAEEHSALFSEMYPGVKVNVIRATGQVVYSRLAQDMKAGVAQADVFSGSDVGHLVELKAQGNLMEFTPPNADKVGKTFQNMMPGYWYATTANPTVMVYNTDMVSEAEAPTNWTDLIDPKWKGKIATAHPGFSGSMGGWTAMVIKLYGEEFLEKLEANEPLIGRSLVDPPTVVVAGERAIGIAPISVVNRQRAAGNPVAIAYPTDGARGSLGGTAILANAPSPNAAQLFVNFLLSVEASELQVSNGLPPLRPEVEPMAGSKPLDDFKQYFLTEEELVNLVPPAIETWRDIFGG